MSVKVSIQPNPTQSGKYRAVLHTGRKATYADFLEHVQGSCTVTEADAQAVLIAAAQWIEKRATEGRAVDLGPLGYSRLAMKGSFAKSPKRIFDKEVKLNISWILPRKLKQRVAKKGEDLVRSRVYADDKQPHIADAREVLSNGERGPNSKTYRAGGALRIAGHRLNYNKQLTDEGVYIRKAGAKRWQRIEYVISVAPSEVLFLMPAELTDDVELELRRRHLANGNVLKSNSVLLKPVAG